VAGGLLITEGVVGCSVTEIDADRCHTPLYAGEAAIALDLVQYSAGRGHPARTVRRPTRSPAKAKGGAMPQSSRYPITELPGTLRCSCREAQETFLRALDDAVRTHGAGDQAHRIAYTALKQKFEKRGDHWIAKDNPADCGGDGKADQLAARGNSSGPQIQRSAS
jgi:hypothetical protein